MQVLMRPQYATTSYNGYVVTYHAIILPPAVSDIPFSVFGATGRDDKNEVFVVQALIWLKPYKKLYASITIRCFEQLPEGGYSDASSSFINTDRTICVYDWGLEEKHVIFFW